MALLTPELIEELCTAIRAGNYQKTACALVGISLNYYQWCFRKGLEPNCKPIYRELVTKVTKAEAELERSVVKTWMDLTPTDWKACRDFLARRFPQNWAAKDKLEVTGAGGGPLVTANVADLRNLTDEELDRLESLVAKIAGNPKSRDDFEGADSEESE